MAHICVIDVPEETTKLMEGLGFYQQQAISPTVKWTNHKGVCIIHLYDQYPRNTDDVVNMVYAMGYNQGVHDQTESFKFAAKHLVDELIDKKSLRKEPRRADPNLLFPDIQS